MQIQYWPNNEKIYNSYLEQCAIQNKFSGVKAQQFPPN